MKSDVLLKNKKMNYNEIIKRIKSLQSPKNVKGMSKFGIRPKTKVYGVSMPELRKIAKIIKKDHKLALRLWDSKIHEAKILASIVANPEEITEKQIDKWVKDFDSWDVCDQVCMNLFNKTKFAYKKVFEFSERKEEFVKRTAFALIAALAVHNKEAKDKYFINFFRLSRPHQLTKEILLKKQ